MLNPPSNDISVLGANVTFDISGTLPLISVENTSEGTGLANVTWWFIATSPSNTPIHTGSETQPDITGVWTTHTLNDSWPRPFNSIEWSGAPYKVVMYAKDGAGNIYSETFTASICRPAGNTQLSKNPYGVGSVNLQTKCEQAKLFFQNTTDVSYKGSEGEMISSTLRVIYPVDETNNIPDPFTISNFSVALVPISYSSDNYQFVTEQVYEYEVSDDTFVRILYRLRKTFPVYCNIDLFPLVCEYIKLIDDVENGNCSDVASANKKLMLINSKMALVFTGLLQPLTGVDVPALIQEIEEIGGFACNCCAAPSGIIPTTASIIDGYSFSVDNLGGDVDGNFVVTGSNIQLQVWDKSYVFNIGASTLSQTSAFSVTPTDSTYSKTYSLNVDLGVLASDLATAIAADGTILNEWKTMLGIGGAASITVDGGCIFQSTSTCNYDFTFSNIPATTTYALLTSITIGTTPQTISYAFNQTNLAGLQTYLNSLGYGSFTVTNLGGNQVMASSLTNSNDIVSIKYKISSTTYDADMSRDCTGYTAISLDEFAANIVNYLCGLDDSKVVTSQGYIICYIDGTGTIQTVTMGAGVSLQSFMSALTLNGCQTIQYIKSLGKVDCDNIKQVFPSNTSLNVTATDFVLGTKGNGVCSRVTFLDAFNYMVTAALTNATSRNLFCELVTSCGGGLLCEPFTYLEAIVTPYDNTCTEAVGIEYTLS